MNAEVAVGTPAHGDVWNGFEWVSPERYEQQRSTTMPDLPPIQPSAPGYHEPDHEGPGIDPDDIEAVHNHQELHNYGRAPCTCPSGDGSLRWPCPQHPPLHTEFKLADVDFAAIEARALAHMLKDPEHVIQALLATVIGENPTRGGLLETPKRVVKAWQHWTSGYGKDASQILKVFEDGAEETDEMVVVRGIPVYSHCEHHLAPIFGTATVAYIPGEEKRIIGLSKMSRLVDMFARRLQVQERLTNQIATSLMENLKPLGCGVVVTARHMCMESRGVQHQSDTTTSALRGNFKDNPTVRAEFLALARNGDHK